MYSISLDHRILPGYYARERTPAVPQRGRRCNPTMAGKVSAIKPNSTPRLITPQRNPAPQHCLDGVFPPLEQNPGRIPPSLDNPPPHARARLLYTHAQKSAVFAVPSIFAMGLIEAPLKFQGCRPPVPISSTAHLEVGPGQRINNRLCSLRQLCLRRDAYRCVVTARPYSTNPTLRKKYGNQEGDGETWNGRARERERGEIASNFV